MSDFTLIRFDNGKRIREPFKTKAAAKQRVIGLNAWADVVDLDDTQLDRIELYQGRKLIYEQGTKP